VSPTLFLLLDAAFRASALGLAVAVVLRLARLNDTRSEILIWTCVLLSALAMPLLRAEPPAWLPGWLSVPLPHLAQGVAAAPAATTISNPVTGIVLGNGAGLALVPGIARLSAVQWLIQQGASLLWILYALVAALQLARLATGLVLTAQLYRNAAPIDAPWARGRTIRASHAVTSPISFGRCILLPADFASWLPNKLDAVLAHEESHIGRGDFFIQLLAALYRALFWFSPFAWWLQAQLCALAEAASDEAAIQRLKDRATYAEILVDVSRHARGLQVQAGQIGMAKGPDIGWRIDRILGEHRERRLGMTARLAAACAILPAALAVAGAHAAVPHAKSRLPLFTVLPVRETFAAASPRDGAMPPQRVSAATKTEPVRRARTARADAESDVTYNPRALLDDPGVAIVPAVIPVSGARSRKTAGGDGEGTAVILGGSVYVPAN